MLVGGFISIPSLTTKNLQCVVCTVGLRMKIQEDD